MAPVGQTCEHSTQLASQYPIRGTRTGVQRPSIPASEKAACNALFGQAFMHSPQRMHRERKYSSSSAPGGRRSRSLRSVAKPGVLRASGTKATPAARPVRTFLLWRFAPRVFCAGKNLNCNPCSGHSSTQFRQRWHSAWCHGTPPIGSSPPWHRSRQRLQSLQCSGFLTRPSKDHRDTMPNNAPSGTGRDTRSA